MKLNSDIRGLAPRDPRFVLLERVSSQAGEMLNEKLKQRVWRVSSILNVEKSIKCRPSGEILRGEAMACKHSVEEEEQK